MDDQTFQLVNLAVKLVFGIIAAYVAPWVVKLIKNSLIAKIVKDSVYSTQQLYWDQPGEERKKHAIGIATEKFNKWGLKITEEQLSELIESAVMALNVAKGKYSEAPKIEVTAKPVAAKKAPVKKAEENK